MYYVVDVLCITMHFIHNLHGVLSNQNWYYTYVSPNICGHTKQRRAEKLSNEQLIISELSCSSIWGLLIFISAASIIIRKEELCRISVQEAISVNFDDFRFNYGRNTRETHYSDSCQWKRVKDQNYYFVCLYRKCFCHPPN